MESIVSKDLSSTELKDVKPKLDDLKRFFGDGKFSSKNETDVARGKRWGFWWTLGLSLIICIFFVNVSGFAAGFLYGFEIAINPEIDKKVFAESFFGTLHENSTFFMLSVFLTTWSTLGLIVLFILIREKMTIQDYLNLKPISFRVLLNWLGITLLMIFAWDALVSALGLIESDFFIKIHKNTDTPIFLLLAAAVAAPLSEELFYRGFLFEGIRESKLGPWGAILVTSLLWGWTHQQYELQEITLIVVFGVILGIAKIKTKSIYAPLAMHSFYNSICFLFVSFL